MRIKKSITLLHLFFMGVSLRFFYSSLISAMCLASVTLARLNQEQSVKILLIGDERAEHVGIPIRNGMRNLSDTLKEVFENPKMPSLMGRARVVRLGELSQAPINRKKIEEAIEALSIGANDSLLVVYHGHGSYDPIAGQMFNFGGGESISRQELKHKLLATKSRLLLYISDCCSIHLPEAVGAAQEVDPLENCYNDLFFKQSGVLDVSSASYGELAWADLKGGYFLQNFCHLITEPVFGRSIDSNGDGFTEWSEVFEQTKIATQDTVKNKHDDMKNLYDQFPLLKLRVSTESNLPISQTPAIFANPSRSGDSINDVKISNSFDAQSKGVWRSVDTILHVSTRKSGTYSCELYLSTEENQDVLVNSSYPNPSLVAKSKCEDLEPNSDNQVTIEISNSNLTPGINSSDVSTNTRIKVVLKLDELSIAESPWIQVH